MTSVLTKSLHAKLHGNPILLSVEGKELDITLDGNFVFLTFSEHFSSFSDKIIRVKVVPSIKGLQKRVSESTCFLLDLTTEAICKVKWTGNVLQKSKEYPNKTSEK